MRARALFGSAMVLSLSACVAEPGNPAEEPASESDAVVECSSGPVTKGIDVSSWQGTINWTKVKASGVHFAIARTGDGLGKDSHFHANWSGMKSAGLVRGVYQFFRPGKDPIQQADLM